MKVTKLRPDVAGLVDWPLLSTARHVVATVGTFDGMHKGHQAVVRRVVELAKKTGSLSVVVMFDRRPALVHAYAAAHEGEEPSEDCVDSDLLTGVDERLRILAGMSVDHVLVVHYTLAFAAKSYRFFLGQLVGKLGMRTLVLGSDATMGAGRSGGIKEIDRLAQATRLFELDVVRDLGPGQVRVPRVIKPEPPAKDHLGEPADPRAGLDKATLRAWSKAHEAREVRVWSSSNARYLLSQGCVQAANDVLGRAHALEGVVVHGEQMGRALGFPTANLGTDIEGYVPVDGVYAGWLVDLGPVERQDAGNSSELSGGDLKADSASNSESASKSALQVAEGNAHAASADSVASARAQHNDSRPLHVDFSRDEARMAAGSSYRWPAAISIGTKPTYRNELGEVERVIEPYAITDDWLELYGHRVRVEFTGFLRAQVAFSGSEELKQAMQDYVDQTLKINAGLNGEK